MMVTYPSLLMVAVSVEAVGGPPFQPDAVVRFRCAGGGCTAPGVVCGLGAPSEIEGDGEDGQG